MKAGLKSALIIGGLCLGIAAAMQAQQTDGAQLPDAPAAAPAPNTVPAEAPKGVVFHKKLFWSLVAADAGSAIADTQISRSGLDMCPNYQEINSWLYGRRPSLGRYYATDAAIDGGAAFLSYKLLHSRRKSFRMLGWLPLAATSVTHADGAIRWAKVINNDCISTR